MFDTWFCIWMLLFKIIYMLYRVYNPAIFRPWLQFVSYSLTPVYCSLCSEVISLWMSLFSSLFWFLCYYSKILTCPNKFCWQIFFLFTSSNYSLDILLVTMSKSRTRGNLLHYQICLRCSFIETIVSILMWILVCPVKHYDICILDNLQNKLD